MIEFAYHLTSQKRIFLFKAHFLDVSIEALGFFPVRKISHNFGIQILISLSSPAW